MSQSKIKRFEEKTKGEERKMLEFNQQKVWYEDNKEFLREFEKTEEFKDYRNRRLRIQKLKKRLDYVQNIFDSIKKPKNRDYLRFYYDELNKQKEFIRNQEKKFEKEFLKMKRAKDKALISFLKKKVNILQSEEVNSKD